MFTSTCHSRRQRNPHTNDEKAKGGAFFSPVVQKKDQLQNASPFFQAKLTMGKANDQYEREADNMAQAVTAKKQGPPIQQKISGIQRLATPIDDEQLGTNDARMRKDRDIQEKPIQQMGEPEEKEKKGVQKKDEPMKEEDKMKGSGSVQAKPDSGAGTASAKVSSGIEHSAGKGNKLPAKSLQEMNHSFGVDFSGVRIHHDSHAEEMSQELSAQAFTHGRDIYFNKGKFDPETGSGKFLLAHELTHVIQQDGDAGIIERKKDKTAAAPLNFVCYSGGHFGTVSVFKDGVLTYSAPAVSGNAGRQQNEKGAGPTPDGRYIIHPQIKNRKVTKPEAGTCGVGAIDAGFQEMSSTTPEACAHHSHYCNVPCSESPVFNCFTTVGCWGEKRIRIEGSHQVVKDDGKKITRDGFFLHGGNPTDLASSGCIKALDMGVFDKIRELKGAVPFFIGNNCPLHDDAADVSRLTNIITGNEKSMEDKSPGK